MNRLKGRGQQIGKRHIENNKLPQVSPLLQPT